VSLYIRDHEDLLWARAHVRREVGVAGNIKTPKTSRLVRAALEAARERLRTVTGVPDGGLALFCGVCGGERVVELLTGARPIEHRGYVCAAEFDLGQIARSLECASGPIVGLVVVDGTGAIGVRVQGGRIDPEFRRQMGRWSSGSRRGGQSALRFSRLREEQEANYITLVSEQVEAAFTRDGLPTVARLVLAGPGDKKTELRARLAPRLRQLTELATTAQGGEAGLLEARAAADRAGEACTLGDDVAAVGDVYLALEMSEHLVAYTPDAVRRAVLDGAAERVVVSEDAADLERLRDECRAAGTALQTVSRRSEAGARLVRELGGAAALLRY
jgi:peptide chain release factor subunit 1